MILLGQKVSIPGGTLTGTVIGLRQGLAAVQVRDHSVWWWPVTWLSPGAMVVDAAAEYEARALRSSWGMRLGGGRRKGLDEVVVGS